MAEVLEGTPRGAGARVGVVASRFNAFVTDRLLGGALEALSRAGVAETDVRVVRVPGSFEIPIAAKKLAETGTVDGVVCLGAIIRGETPHWEYLSHAVSQSVAQAALATGLPFAFGILTTETREAALARAGERGDNKGYEAALALVEMIDLLRRLEGTKE